MVYDREGLEARASGADAARAVMDAQLAAAHDQVSKAVQCHRSNHWFLDIITRLEGEPYAGRGCLSTGSSCKPLCAQLLLTWSSLTQTALPAWHPLRPLAG